MEFLELPRVEPSPGARAVAASLSPRRAGTIGAIGLADAEMLLTLIERADARKAIEIGVASGLSSLHMLAMLKTLSGRRQLFAFDNNPRYYADESKPCGYIALDSEFNRDGAFVLNTEATSLDLGSTLAAHAFDPAAPVDIAFIDGDHRHPWPTIDFLLLLPLMRESGTIVLHDINLPAIIGADHSFGPRRLFAQPFPERFVGGRGGRPNMGVIRLGARAAMTDLALASLAQTWESTFDPGLARRLVNEARGGALAERIGDFARYFTTLD